MSQNMKAHLHQTAQELSGFPFSFGENDRAWTQPWLVKVGLRKFEGNRSGEITQDVSVKLKCFLLRKESNSKRWNYATLCEIKKATLPLPCLHYRLACIQSIKEGANTTMLGQNMVHTPWLSAYQCSVTSSAIRGSTVVI